MSSMSFPGKLIVFEGPDGTGKSTQIDLVYNEIFKSGITKVVKTKEPGGTNLGSRIRNLILDTEYKIPPITQLMLFQADRNIHYEYFLKPKLEDGYIILCDRFYLSTLVYQHKINGINEDLVVKLNTISTNNLTPDRTFVFLGKNFNKEYNNNWERNFGEENYNKLNQHYFDYCKRFNYYPINANRPKEEITQEILEELSKFI